MNKQSVISLLRKAKQPLSQSCGVKQLGLFGSTVRESNTESSDVDILIDFEDDKETYSNFLLACEILEKLFDRLKVDIVTLKGLSPFIGQQILKEENHGADTCITWGLSWGACALSASRRPVWSEGFVG